MQNISDINLCKKRSCIVRSKFLAGKVSEHSKKHESNLNFLSCILTHKKTINFFQPLLLVFTTLYTFEAYLGVKRLFFELHRPLKQTQQAIVMRFIDITVTIGDRSNTNGQSLVCSSGFFLLYIVLFFFKCMYIIR